MAPPPPPAVRKASPTPLNPSLAKLGGQATDADRGALLKALNTGGVRAGLRPTQTVDKSAPVVKAEIEEGISDKEALETLKKSTAASEAAPASPKKLTRQYTNKTSVKSAPPPAPAPPPPPMAPPVEHVRKTSPAPKNAAALSKLGGKATDADRGELLKALNAGGARAGLRPTQTVDKSAPVVTAQIEEGTSTKEALEKLKSLPADSTTAKTTSIYSGAPKRTSVSESPKKTTATEASKKPAPLDLPKKTVVTELAKKEITEVPQSPRGKKGGVSSAIKMFTTPASPVKKAPPTGVRKAVITDVTKKATEPTEPPPKKVTTTAAAAAKVANGTSTTAAVKPANGTTAAKAANGTTAPRKLHTFGPWEQKESAKGRIYYWNNDTKKSQWTRPLEWPAPKKAGLKKQATIEKKRATLKKQATIEEKKKKFLLHRGESEWDELEELLNGVDTSELDLDEILNDDASDDD
ncbi:hypothetical protein AAVH_31228 [Aphelenchoides avenae]|nr:hypothetical protein AAVH_31228 [Aphelenchus avenae]